MNLGPLLSGALFMSGTYRGGMGRDYGWASLTIKSPPIVTTDHGGGE